MVQVISGNCHPHYWKTNSDEELNETRRSNRINRNYSMENSERLEQRDLQRRIAVLESKQDSLESIVKIGASLAILGGLGVVAHKNQDKIQDAAKALWKQIPSTITTRCETVWSDLVKCFMKYFKTS